MGKVELWRSEFLPGSKLALQLVICHRCSCPWNESYEQCYQRLQWVCGWFDRTMQLSGLFNCLWSKTSTPSIACSLAFVWFGCCLCHHVDLLHGIFTHIFCTSFWSLVLQVKFRMLSSESCLPLFWKLPLPRTGCLCLYFIQPKVMFCGRCLYLQGAF